MSINAFTYMIRTLLLNTIYLSWISSVYAQEPVTTTVVDILSENVEFSYFLRLLQRNQLIPYLNQLSDVTLAAPVNSAFASTLCPSIQSNDICINELLGNFGVSSLNKYVIDQPLSSTAIQGYEILKSLVEDTKTFLVPSPILVHINETENIFEINNADVVELDLYADSQNSYVQGLDRPFSNDKTIRESIKDISDAKVFESLIGDRDVSNKTILIPRDNAFEFENYQLEYLRSSYGEEDTDYLLKSLIFEGFHGGDVNENLVDLNGFTQKVGSINNGSQVTINETIISEDSNKIAVDSVYHIFENSSILQKIDFNPLKTLVGLGAQSFVDELTLQKLGYLIEDNDIEQTIFYAQDSNQFSIQSKSTNLYHFVNETILDLSEAKLLYNTRFCSTKKLGDACQKIKIEAIGDNSYLLNNNILVEEGPFIVGNTAIYLTDDNVRTPGDFLSSVNPVYHCSTSMNYLTQLGLHKLSNNKKGYTVFLPCYDSYDDFALTFNYLENNRTALEIIMKNLILEGLVYTDVNETSITLQNLNKIPITLDNITYSENGDLNFDFSDDSITLKKDNDLLFSQGVIHPIREFVLPNEIEITLSDIIINSDSDLFLSVLEFFPGLLETITKNHHSILLPTPFSLSKILPFDSNKTLESFLKAHIIPASSLSSLYECEDEIETLNPLVNLTCTKISKRGDSLLQIKNGADRNVRVLSKGCTSYYDHSCVYLLDKPIDLDWLNDDTHYHITLPGIALGLGILLGSLIMVIILVCVMLVVLRKRTLLAADGENSENTNGNSNEQPPDPNENSSLISTSTENRGRTFESGYSSNSVVEPITFASKKNPEYSLNSQV